MRACVFAVGVLMCFLFTRVSKAQTCTGSLGDPVVHIDFGSGTSVQGAPLAPGITTYTFVNGKPNDGQYTIASSTANMWATWFVTTDHSGTGNGYMMIANASYTSDTFYIDTIRGLCPGTTYEFAAWMLNLNKAQASTANFSLPNITFSVEKTDGTPLATPRNTGNIPQTTTPTWVQYGLTFTTPANQNTVVIKMTNNAPGGAGNDILLDDITFRPCGPTMMAGFGSGATSTYNNCTGNPQTDTLTAQVSTGYVNPAYQWQINTGSGWTNIAGATSTRYIFTTPTNAGTYQYRLASAEAANISSSNCQVLSNTTTLTVIQSPTATATSNGPVICEGQTLNLSASGGNTYSWTDPNGVPFSTSQSPVISNITPSQAGKYTVTATSNGCSSVASVTITVQPKITAKVNADTTICQGNNVQLNASGGLKYLWTPSTGLSNDTIANPVATPTATTAYTVTATNGSCSSTATVNITVIPPPVISAGGNKKIIQGQSVKLNATAKGINMTYWWTPATYLSDANSLTPVATPPTDITYTLHVSSGCFTVTDSAYIKVYKKIVVPSMFSPNADGVNDIWVVTGLDAYPSSTLTVYNRNGQQLFTTIGGSTNWDGTYNTKPLPEGVYYYIIDLRNNTPLLSGYVTIIR